MLVLRHYIQLTKPSIVLLVVITAMAALAVEGFLFESFVHSLFMLLAIGAAAGSANAFNQYMDRDIDSVMSRTRKKRPIPLGQIQPWTAFAFALSLGLLSTVYLWWQWNLLAAVLSVATILFYTLVYTAGLKRRHHYNVVIGGAAGAAGPLIAWAAVTGQVSLYAWIFFLIIFMWTPAHFWALALAIKDEYQQVNVPMLPVVRGEKRTRIEIWLYTASLLPLTLVPYWIGEAGLLYFLASLGLWIWYFLETHRSFQASKRQTYMRLFYISIIYLFLLCIVISIDGAIQYYGF